MRTMFHCVLVIILACGSVSCQWDDYITNMTVNTQSTCVRTGFDLELNCSIQKKLSTVGASNIIFKRCRHEVCQLVNVTKTQGGVFMKVKNITIEDTGTYYCCLQDKGIECLDGVIVDVGEPPPEPKNFTCHSYNSQNLLCSWITTDLNVTWTLQYQTSAQLSAICTKTRSSQCGYGSSFHLCGSKNDCIHHTCEMVEQEDTMYYFKLIGSGPFGTSTYNYRIYVNETIDMLGNLTNCNHIANGSSMDILWTFAITPDGYSRGIFCIINYTSRYSSQSRDHLYTGSDKTAIYTLDLHPDTSYSVSLTCKVASSSYWGHTLKCPVFKTPEDVPLIGPTTTNASYTYWRSGNKLHVQVYIQPPDAFHSQGPLTGYKMRTQNWTKTFPVNHATLDIQLPTDIEQFHLTMWALTQKGPSKKATYMVLNTSRKGDNAISEVIVERNSTGYLVSCTKHSVLKDVIFHWCLVYDTTESVHVTCLDKYSFNASEGQCSLFLSPHKDQGRISSGWTWLFGVSLPNSRIRWEDCSFDDDGREIDKPEQLRNTDQDDSTKITVIFPDFCSYKSRKGPRPLQYKLEYSELNTNTKKSIFINASSNMGKYDITKLRDGTSYSVKYLIVYSKDSSEFCDPIYVTTASIRSVAADKFKGKIAGGVIGGVIFLIICLILVCKVQQRWKKIDTRIEFVHVVKKDIKENKSGDFSTIASRTSDSGRGTISSTDNTEIHTQTLLANAMFQQETNGYFRRENSDPVDSSVTTMRSNTNNYVARQESVIPMQNTPISVSTHLQDMQNQIHPTVTADISQPLDTKGSEKNMGDIGQLSASQPNQNTTASPQLTNADNEIDYSIHSHSYINVTDNIRQGSAGDNLLADKAPSRLTSTDNIHKVSTEDDVSNDTLPSLLTTTGNIRQESAGDYVLADTAPSFLTATDNIRQESTGGYILADSVQSRLTPIDNIHKVATEDDVSNDTLSSLLTATDNIRQESTGGYLLADSVQSRLTPIDNIHKVATEDDVSNDTLSSLLTATGNIRQESAGDYVLADTVHSRLTSTDYIRQVSTEDNVSNDTVPSLLTATGNIREASTGKYVSNNSVPSLLTATGNIREASTGKYVSNNTVPSLLTATGNIRQESAGDYVSTNTDPSLLTATDNIRQVPRRDYVLADSNTSLLTANLRASNFTRLESNEFRYVSHDLVSSALQNQVSDYVHVDAML